MNSSTGVLVELAPVATRPQLDRAMRLPLVLRIGCGLLAALLMVGFLWVSIAGAVRGLRDPSSLDTVGEGDDSVIIVNYLTILVLSLFALVVSWGVNGVRAGGFPRGAARAAGRLFVGTAALVYVPLIGCTTIQVLLTIFGAVPQASGIQSSPVVGLITSLGSGVSEEVFVVAIPVALLDAFLRGRRAPTGPAAAARGRPDAARSPAGVSPVATTLIVVLLAAARISYHVYYGWSALVLAPWAVLSVVIYLRTRAILPLMICHVVYDGVLQLPGLLGLTVVVVLAVLAVVAARRRVRRARGDTPPQPPISPRSPGVLWGLPAPPEPARGRTAPSPFAPPDRSGPR